jgi:hypothetical protein
MDAAGFSSGIPGFLRFAPRKALSGKAGSWPVILSSFAPHASPALSCFPLAVVVVSVFRSLNTYHFFFLYTVSHAFCPMSASDGISKLLAQPIVLAD